MVSRLKHDNVVKLLGYCVDGGLRLLAYEYASNRSVHDILHGRKGVKGAQPDPVLSWSQRVKCTTIIGGAIYLLHNWWCHLSMVVSLCMSPVNDSFMSGSLDHSVRIWDLCVNACQGILRLRGRAAVAYDQQGLVFTVAMEGTI